MIKLIMQKKFMIVILGVIILVIIIIFSNPLRQTSEIIQAHILELTPIGTSIGDVIKVIENNENWKVWNLNSDGNWKPLPSDSKSYIDVLIERKSIDVLLGTYDTVLTTSVSVTWRFDDDLKLKSVEVDKSTDVL